MRHIKDPLPLHPRALSPYFSHIYREAHASFELPTAKAPLGKGNLIQYQVQMADISIPLSKASWFHLTEQNSSVKSYSMASDR